MKFPYLLTECEMPARTIGQSAAGEANCKE